MTDSAPLLLVTGPTASGKSSLALRLARDLNGEIVNVDSVQIYSGMDIGSAKLKGSERDGIAHHMIDVRDPDRPCNVGEFISEASACITDIQRRGKTCVLCGGSSLYITCLLHGLAQVPKADYEVRRRLASLDSANLFELLKREDPESAAKLHQNDRVRVMRALETVALSGRRASDLRGKHSYQESPFIALILVLCRQRSILYERIDRRSLEMVEGDLLTETSQLADRFGTQTLALQSLGYAQCLKCLRGELDSKQLVSEIAMHTRRFAKRQLTFWRNEPAKRGWARRPGTVDGDWQELDYCGLVAQTRTRLAEPFSANEVWYLDAARLS